MKAVATGDKIAGDFVRCALRFISDARPVAVNIVQSHIMGGINRRRTEGGTTVHQVLGDLGLAVDHHSLAGHLPERQPVPRAIDADLGAFVNDAVGMHAGADAGFVQQIHRDLLDDTGADPTKDVGGGLALQDDGVDAVPVQQLAEQQAGRSGADDDDLRTH